MIIRTPKLDQLTAAVKVQFLESTAEHRQILGDIPRPTLSPETTDYLRTQGESTSVLIRDLFGLVGFVYEELARERLGWIANSSAVSHRLAEEVLKLVQRLDILLHGQTQAQLQTYRDEDIGAVLMDLYHIGGEEFNPHNPANALEYNADDPLPTNSESPRDHLDFLMYAAVSARLIKGSGYELIMADLDTYDPTRMTPS